MTQLLRRARRALGLVALVALAGCASDDDDIAITGPDFPRGEGRVYAVNDVTFPTSDGVSVAASYGRTTGAGAHPSVILVHDVGATLARQEWLSAGLFEDLLAAGYNVLAIDLRGHGQTPLPDDGRTQQVLYLDDLEDMHLDVRAAITWLRSQASAQRDHIAVIGNGIGANVAFVTMGAFPDDLQAAVALSPGFWDQDYQPLVVGSGIAPFAPHSVLYMAGENDMLAVSETQVLSYPDFARALASVTQDPDVEVLPGVSGHGLALLQAPGALSLILDWLANNL